MTFLVEVKTPDSCEEVYCASLRDAQIKAEYLKRFYVGLYGNDDRCNIDARVVVIR
jgi:hypothetical protein